MSDPFVKLGKYLFLGIISLNISCKEENDTYFDSINPIEACGLDDPLNQLDWLCDLVMKSMDDKTGNYIGNIWIFSYEENDIVVTDMALGSGGVLYHIFDCGGKLPTADMPTIAELPEFLVDSNLIFSNVPN